MTKTEAKVLNKIYKFVEDNQMRRNCISTGQRQRAMP